MLRLHCSAGGHAGSQGDRSRGDAQRECAVLRQAEPVPALQLGQGRGRDEAVGGNGMVGEPHGRGGAGAGGHEVDRRGGDAVRDRFPGRRHVDQQAEHPIVGGEDDGPGLSDDDLHDAFARGLLRERYREAREVGTGLGLSIATHLAARMGGRVVAGHSATPPGARFTLELPRP